MNWLRTAHYALLVLVLGLGLPACGESKKERELRVERQRQEQERLDQEAYQASPRGKLERTREQMALLETKIVEEYKPREGSYGVEYMGFVSDLRAEIPRSGVTSLEELLRNRERYAELAFTLDKAAKTKFWLDRLEKSRREAEATVLQLEHEAWELEKRIDLGEIMTDAELAGIEEAISRAQVLLDEQTPDPERQDIAEIQQELFSAVVGSLQ